ncbi:hypothetical protein KFK09_029316 [Dendrobium nobile]|uniref:Uncharacterized protein n=1 Tax=Dendrobium nobile TaxID=94219 RepID=A0A8T3A191_DENNO|nr:hypothetical protein KFK09_029316 [Dendrobium nobile]
MINQGLNPNEIKSKIKSIEPTIELAKTSEDSEHALELVFGTRTVQHQGIRI